MAEVSTNLVSKPRPSEYAESTPHAVEDERFAERRRIALMEPDSALRSTLVRFLLRLGVVVTFKHAPPKVIEAMNDGNLDGAIVALESDSPWIAEIRQANMMRQIPIVILTNASPGPHEVEVTGGVRFLVKPFDVRELCELLRLPPKARIIPAG
jgi:DNA-binding response OmpR family regulator